MEYPGVVIQTGPRRVKGQSKRGIGQRDDATVLVLSTEAPDLDEQARDLAEGASSEQAVAVVISRGADAGRAAASMKWRKGSDAVRVDAIRLPGLVLTRALNLSDEYLDHGEAPRRNDRYWSRTRGALTDETWENIVGLHVGIVGCGRLGGAIAMELGRLGVGRFTLIDEDIVEEHNLGETPFLRTLHLGVPKVSAVAAELEANYRLPDAPRVDTVRTSVGTFLATDALADCDLVISAADEPIARAIAALVCSAHLIPHLDIATDIHTDFGRQRLTGDVRLTFPGDACLHCLGGFAGRERIHAELASGWPIRRIAQAWHEERDGSLRSLNMQVIALALRTIEAHAGGALQESAWIQYQDSDGLPATIVTTRQAVGDCPVCLQAGTAQLDIEALLAATA